MRSNLQPFTIHNEPFFKKALEINGLVRSIVKNLASSASIFDLRDSVHLSERCLDALQISALQLPSAIAEAEVAADYHKKIRFQEYIFQMTEDLEVYCSVIKGNRKKTKGLNKLIKAVGDFRNLRHHWELKITQQN
ncbi:hypothetical protein EAX61_10905 [Dokdonia sinensis]|uniref:Four helix bundle protein n=1 Tax=Dokdonia sinensis TaxID=2479847 RepID=A0A3M0FYS4_9FLAO|nr:hypothetical protein [Dokdonia sinensis]RMB57615.1 hypothetical protein EAX61_10905 [Dokdonia sinensis]